MIPSPATIPGELRALPNWCLWKKKHDPKRPKPLKMPYGKNGRPLQTNNPATWLTFEAALTLATQLTTDGAPAYDGIGFVFTGTPYVGVDVDGVPPAEGLVLVAELLPAYAEISQSGNGLHVICRGSAPAGSRRRGNVEMYDGTSPRYFALTGQVLGTPVAEIPERTAALAAFHARHIGGVVEPATAPGPTPPDDGDGLTPDDRAVLRALRVGSNAKRFFGLYDGGEYREGKRSECDYDLALMICRATPDDESVIRLMASSALYRPRWLEKRRQVTLLRWTVQQARLEAGRRAAGEGAESDDLPYGDELEDLADPAWLIPGKVPEGAFVVLYGQPGTGKTFLMMDWALGLAHSGATVVYVAAEGKAGIKKRAKAWCLANGVAAIPRTFRPKRGNVDLLDPERVARFLANVQAKTNGAGIKAFVFDTLNRNMPGGSENASEDMSAVIGAVTAIQEGTGAAVFLVHHTRKDDLRSRGHSSLEGAADTMILLEAEGDDTRVLRCTKQKDADEFDAARFALTEIELGPGVTSQVVGPATDGPGKPLTRTESRWLELLDDLLAAAPAGVKRDEWLEAARRAGFSTSNDSRTLGGLAKKGYVIQQKSRFRRATAQEAAVAREQEERLDEGAAR